MAPEKSMKLQKYALMLGERKTRARRRRLGAHISGRFNILGKYNNGFIRQDSMQRNLHRVIKAKDDRSWFSIKLVILNVIQQFQLARFACNFLQIRQAVSTDII